MREQPHDHEAMPAVYQHVEMPCYEVLHEAVLTRHLDRATHEAIPSFYVPFLEE